MQRLTTHEVRTYPAAVVDVGTAVTGPRSPHGECQISASLPALSDQHVYDTVTLADAFELIRTSLLGMSGMVLLAHVSVSAGTDTAGIVTGLYGHLVRARDTLSRALRSTHPGVRRRAYGLSRAVAILDDELDRVRAAGHARDVSTTALRTVSSILGESSLLEAGMLRFGSASCAESQPNTNQHVIITASH